MPKGEIDLTIQKRLKFLGMVLREIRKGYQVNIAEASQDMGINRNTLSNIERSVGDISLSTLYKISDYYGISISEILKGINDK